MRKHTLSNPFSSLNKKSRQEPHESGSATTVEEVIDSLKAVSYSTDINEFVHIIKQMLEEKKSLKGSTSGSEKDSGSTSKNAKVNRPMWSSLMTSGAIFLKFVNDHMEEIEDMKDLYSDNSRVVAEILDQIEQLHWAVGGLAIVAYLIEKFDEVSANKGEVLEVLCRMVDLVTTVVKLKNIKPEGGENMKKAVMMVLEGSIMCVSQIYSLNIFSCLRTSVNSINWTRMSDTLDHLYRDLNSEMLNTDLTSEKCIDRNSETTELKSEVTWIKPPGFILRKRKRHVIPKPLIRPSPLTKSKHQSKCQSEMAAESQLKPFYPKEAVGIETARKAVTKLLNMTTIEDESMLVVVYGVGGIGKTTLAHSVVAELNLHNYNYAMVRLNENMSKNDLKKKQEEILKYAFPSFYSKAIILRDCEEGRYRLTEAFGCVVNKPVFLFIDNVLRSEDLKELLPEDLSGLPKHSRIFITTRTLKATDGFLTSGIKRCPFVMKTLDKHYAKRILFQDLDSHQLKEDYKKRILRICGGVPLALKIVHNHLVYKKSSKSQEAADGLLGALEKGGYVQEKKLSRRLLHSVYNELEDSTKDAFLDICWFLNGWIRRHVEYIVGASEVKSLEEAALVTPFVDKENMEGIYAGEERLIVHSILSARGRSLSASTRFTDVGFFRQAAQDKTKLKGVKGLWFGPSGYVLELQHLNLMRNSLRIMSLGCNMRTSAQSPIKFKELRYLKFWEAVPHTPMKLEELDMLGIFDGPNIFPNGINMIKFSKRLRMIRNINQSQIATFEDSSTTQGIQNHSLKALQLFVGNDKQLEGLDQLRSLRILSLNVYVDYLEFPEQICKLSSLIKLRIVGWRRLKHLPQSFGRLEGLTHVELRDCFELEELSSSFGELTALEHLSLAYCPVLKQLPGGLESLRYLDVRGCENLSLEFYQFRPDLRIVRDS